MDEKRVIQNYYQKLVKTAIRIDKNKSGPQCRNCWYYHPEFRYRRCLYATCLYGKGNEVVFRKKPLRYEKYPKREAPDE